MYISCQNREGDLDEFFRNENQGCPPSLSDQGNLHLPKKKSELTECLEALTVPQSQMPRNLDVIIIDGAAVVNMVKPGQNGLSLNMLQILSFHTLERNFPTSLNWILCGMNT